MGKKKLKAEIQRLNTEHNNEVINKSKQIAMLEAKLDNALSPDGIWNLVNNGLKYNELNSKYRILEGRYQQLKEHVDKFNSALHLLRSMGSGEA